MTQGKLGDRVNVIPADGPCTAPGRMRPRRSQPDEVGTQAINTRSETTLGNHGQRLIIQFNLLQAVSRLLATLTQRVLRIGPTRTKNLRLGIKG